MLSSSDLEKGLMGIEETPVAPESDRDEDPSMDIKEAEGVAPQDPVKTEEQAPPLRSGSILNDAIDEEHGIPPSKRRASDEGLERRKSYENIREIGIQSTLMDSEPPRKSIEFLVDPNFVNLERPEQREKIMQYLRRRTGEASEPGREARQEPGTASVNQLLALADEHQSQRSFKFNRFERLCLLDLLMAQDRLIRLDERVQYEARDETADYLETHLLLHKSVQTYGFESIEAFQKISRLNQPGFEESHLAGQKLALALDEPRYWDSPDALNLFDLADSEAVTSVDRLRQELQKRVPLSMLDPAGRERRTIDVGADLLRKKAKTSGSHRERRIFHFAEKLLLWLRIHIPFGLGLKKTPAGADVLDGLGAREIKRIIDSSRQHATYISPVVDNIARLLVAVIGGLLVLVPMAALSYITSLHWILIAAFLFTFIFSVAVAVTSRASNDQVIAATAAYGAILVIFVANRIQKGS
ncbi:hypothetical protein V8E51_005334 [Hyaloscypha variabilis]